MKIFLALLISLVAISLLTAPVFSCGLKCPDCTGSEFTFSSPVTMTMVPKAVIHAGKAGIHQAIMGLKIGIKTLSNVPSHVVKIACENSGDARVAFENAAYQTQITFATISAKVTSLSVYLFRSAFSTFWGLLLGLWR